jgi:peptidoglycan/LPS O-acetylase OafA/YrhL
MIPSPPYRPLGALRFALALMVVAQHYQYLLPGDQREWLKMLGLGAVAVSVFFVISGFIVADACHHFYARRPAAFLANRFLRLAPPYYAALLLSVAVHVALWHGGRLALWDYPLAQPPWSPKLLVTGLAGLLPGLTAAGLTQNFEFIPYSWSLRIECAFYLVAAAAFAADNRFKGAARAIWGLGFTLCVLFLSQGKPGFLSNMPMFLLGGALWCRHAPACIAALILSGIGFASWHQHGQPALALQLPLALALVCGTAILIPCEISAKLKKLDQGFGNLSYPLYLNHYALGIMLTNVTDKRGIVIYGAAIALGIALAYAMAQLTEAPLAARRQSIRGVAL